MSSNRFHDPLQQEIRKRPLSKELRAELAELRAMPLERQEHEMHRRNAISVLNETVDLFPLPGLARDHIFAVRARVLAGTRRAEHSDPDARERLHQWQTWHAKLVLVLDLDGVQICRGLAKHREHELFELLDARLRRQLAALRALELPWWPIYGGAASLLDYAESTLAKCEARLLRT